jgi:F-type H+-transporting ATPase subunit delta
LARAASARRYAQAVFEIAQESSEERAWLDDLARIVEIFDDREIQSFLENPKVSFDQKKQSLEPHFSGMKELAQNFAYLLVQKRRVGIAGDIAHEYQSFLDSLEDIAPVAITTAVPLGKAEQDHVAEKIQTIIGKKLRLTVREDSSIIGGLIARVGDQVIDGSTRSRLNSLRESLHRQAR